MKAECLSLALRATKGRRSADWKAIANRFAAFAVTEDHLRALTLAIEHPGDTDDILVTAGAYHDYIAGKEPVPETAQEPAPVETTGQAAKPRKTGRRGGSRKRA